MRGKEGKGKACKDDRESMICFDKGKRGSYENMKKVWEATIGVFSASEHIFLCV
jgi:hypothetical protein